MLRAILNIFITFLLVNSLAESLAQQNDVEFGIPLIKNYLSQDYSANVQNWSAIQAKDGIMYFANVSGVLEYDGINWKLIQVPNHIVRTLAIDDDGIIYVGGINEIGYLSVSSNGAMIYRSLNSLITNGEPDFGDIWRIIPQKEGLYFQTFNSLYLIKSNANKNLSYLNRLTKIPSIVKWTTRTRINPIHSIGNRIFVHERNIGLQEMSEGKLKMLPGGEKFAQDLICIMLPFDNNKILIGSLRRGLFLFDGSGFIKFNSEIDSYLIENRLYFRGEVLKNGDIALGTQLGGIVIIDKLGKLKSIYNKKNGLNNNTVWNLYSDKEGNLWAALDNGIAKILYPSQVNLIDERYGIEGAIQSLKIFDNYFYVSTSSGIYYAHLNTGEKRFYKIKNVSVQSWDFIEVNNRILAATNDGIFGINGSEAIPMDENLRYTYTLYHSNTDPRIIYAGLHNGLAVFRIENKMIKYQGRVEGLSSGITNIAEDENGSLWCNEISGRLLNIIPPGNKSDLINYRFEKQSESKLKEGGLKFCKAGNRMIFYNNNQVYSKDANKNSFDRFVVLDKILSDSSAQILNIFPDNQDNLWIITLVRNRLMINKWDAETKNVVHLNNLQFFSPVNTSDFSNSKFYLQPGNKSIFWIAANEKLLRYNLNSSGEQITSFRIQPVINKVVSNSQSIVNGNNYSDTENSKVPYEINYSSNSIMFEYSLPSFINETANEFQFMLSGFENEWSEWSKISKKEYTNLSPGTYSFKLRGRNSIGTISDIAYFNFTVLPPWYRTWWVNLLGFALIIFIINYVVKYRVNYLKKRNIVLEKLVAERTEEISEQKATLEKQAKELLELDRLKSNFFANISHEFRTPLTLIKGQIENILGIVKDENIRKKLSVAFNNSNRLNRLINQILDLSRLESGTIKLELDSTDLIQLIKTRLASFEALAEKKNITIKSEYQSDILQIDIDRERIEEVIDNLLSNAIKFTPEKGLIFLKVEKSFNGLSQTAVITITDTGIGIPEEKLSHIFERFYQVDNSSTKEYEGSGLGLAIVKDLIELHGGTISVESTINKSTAFKIHLPIDEFESMPQEMPIVDTSFDIKEDDKPLILIIEDNADVRNYIKENLENKYRIQLADNGETGIQKAVELIPDLIITDVMMPKVDGFQLCSNLKNDHKTSHIPIIILTAKADEENKYYGLSTGADEFLAKPFSPRELEIRVGNLIRIRQLLREKYKEMSVIRSEEIKAESIDKEFLEKSFNMIRSNVENRQFSVQMLADEMAMSVSQLNRKLNALINQSAGKLIRSTKLDYASKLLEKNAGNITEIAYRVGFSDISSFTNSYKEKFGISPSEYQKKFKI